jgi:metal-dependent amidase/aminoacylase/carboxypeptidase family protein
MQRELVAEVHPPDFSQHFHADHPVFSCSKSEQKQLNTWVSFQSAEEPLLGQFSVSGDSTARLSFIRVYPPTINDASQSAFAANVAREVLGADKVIGEIEPVMPSEDFSFLLQKVPGCYAFLGNGSGEHRGQEHGNGPCELHNPSFDFNDELLPVGATYFVRLVQAFLDQPG